MVETLPTPLNPTQSSKAVEVSIAYCQNWRHALRAVWMTGEILTRMGDSISALTLIPAGHGTFDIRINGELVGEHTHGKDAQGSHTQLFPDYLEIMQKINEALTGESMGVGSGAAVSSSPEDHDHDGHSH